jgi:hypothetical protein
MSTAENKLDFFEVGDKSALVCAGLEVSEAVRTTLRELGFKFHTADTADLAIERTRYNPYDIIIVQDTFAGSSRKSNPVLNYLSPLPMGQRRNSMIVLIGTDLTTLDAMEAFAESVQLVVNTIDLPNFTAVLKKSWAEFESTYRVYRQTFAVIGEK